MDQMSSNIHGNIHAISSGPPMIKAYMNRTKPMVSGLLFEFVDAILDTPVVGVHFGQLRTDGLDRKFERREALLDLADAMVHAPHDLHQHSHVFTPAVIIVQQLLHLSRQKVQVHVFSHALHISTGGLKING